MSPILILAASLTATPLPVQPQFHPVDAQAKSGLRLDKQLARPAPVLFESRAVRDSEGRWQLACDSIDNERLKSLPDFGVHLRRR